MPDLDPVDGFRSALYQFRVCDTAMFDVTKDMSVPIEGYVVIHEGLFVEDHSPANSAVDDSLTPRLLTFLTLPPAP